MIGAPNNMAGVTMLPAVALREYLTVTGFAAPGRIGKPGLNWAIGKSTFTGAAN